jgi:hypothetical protein
MVTGAGWRQALRLVEEVAVLLREGGQEGMLSVESGRRQLGLRSRRRGTTDSLPPDTAAHTPEGQFPGIEIPKDGPQSAKKVDAEDEVEVAQVARRL